MYRMLLGTDMEVSSWIAMTKVSQRGLPLKAEDTMRSLTFGFMLR